MSTEGAGKCCLTLGSPLLIGIGAGVLLGTGALMAGEAARRRVQLEDERYAKKLEDMRAASRAEIDAMPGFLASQLELLKQAEEYRQAIQQPQAMNQEEQRLLRVALEQVREVIAGDGSQISAAESERRLLRLRLQTLLETQRTQLLAEDIQRAEEALNASPGEMRSALHLLEEARNRFEETRTQEERQYIAIERLLYSTDAHLRAVQKMLREAGSVQTADLIERQKAVEVRLTAAKKALEDRQEEALELANEAQRLMQVFSDAASQAISNAWNEVYSQVNALRGSLDVLRKMIREARVVHMAERYQLDDLSRLATEAYDEVESIVQGTSLEVQSRLKPVKERVELLKQDIFALVERYQQQGVAETIAMTLEELGFGSVSAGKPVVQKNGDTIRVVGTYIWKTADLERDDKMVSFDISLNGDVRYDFSGYTGNSCVEDAEKIFASLRKKGLFILEPSVAERVQEHMVRGERVSAEMLSATEFLLHPMKNKMQAELAERLYSVLERMEYHNIQQNVVGGCIEFDAFNGSTGYRVILEPDGTARVFKDEAHIDISTQADDPIVAEASSLREEHDHRNVVQKRRRETYSKGQQQRLQGR